MARTRLIINDSNRFRARHTIKETSSSFSSFDLRMGSPPFINDRVLVTRDNKTDKEEAKVETEDAEASPEKGDCCHTHSIGLCVSPLLQCCAEQMAVD